MKPNLEEIKKQMRIVKKIRGDVEIFKQAADEAERLSNQTSSLLHDYLQGAREEFESQARQSSEYLAKEINRLIDMADGL